MSKLSVIIPTLNEEHHIGCLLSDIVAQTKKADAVLVVDAGSTDGTTEVVRRFPFARLVEATPPVACGRNLAGRSANGDVLILLDADVRLSSDFFERFLQEFEHRQLDVACPLYVPYRSTRTVERFHALINLVMKAFQRFSPSGSGMRIVVRGDLFRGSNGFDPGLKFHDLELIRRLSKGRRFGIVERRVFVSARRFREEDVLHTILTYSLLLHFFALGRFWWANRIDYEFGKHKDCRRRSLGH